MFDDCRSLAELFDKGRDVAWLVDGIIPVGSATMLLAPEKAFKTTLLLDLCMAAAQGTEWLGRKVAKTRAFMITIEDCDEELRLKADFRLEARGLARSEISKDQFRHCTSLVDFSHGDALEQLTAYLRDSDIGLLVLDPIYAMLPDYKGRNLVEGQLPLAISNACRMAGCTCIAAVHRLASGKGLASAPTGFRQWAGCWLDIEKKTIRTGMHELSVGFGGRAGQAGKFKINVDEAPEGERATQCKFSLDPEAIADTSSQSGTKCTYSKVKKLFDIDPTIGAKEVIATIGGGSNTTAQKHLKRCREELAAAS